MTPQCRHCKKNKACRPRGLCWPCHENKAVRSLYPVHKNARRGLGLRDGEREIVCWACNKPAPGGTRCSLSGWHTRTIRLTHVVCQEIYCPECFAEWGWPDPPPPTPYHVLFPKTEAGGELVLTIARARNPIPVGTQFGEWEVIDRRQWASPTSVYYLWCECSCGRKNYVCRKSLANGSSRRCQDCANQRQSEIQRKQQTA